MNTDGQNQPTLFPQPRADVWPRLSTSLTGPRHPMACQACGWELGPDSERLTRWQEFGDDDKPQPILVVLCRECADRLVKDHPRLYRELERNEPWTGALSLCADCRYRDGLACRNPLLKANGGEGLKLTIAKPSVTHVDFRGKGGRRQGETLIHWPHPASACAGREELES